MKDRLAVIGWCSGAGALIVLGLLMRSGMEGSSASIQSPPSAQTLNVQPVPLPPPPSVSAEMPAADFEQDLEKQQELTQDLQDELERQRVLAADLKAQLERQQDETTQVLDQLSAYQDSVEAMADQQVRLMEAIPQQNQTQTMLLWGIVGLFLLLLVGGGGVMLVLALWLMQIQRQTQRPAVMYPVHLPPDPYHYYERQSLPAPSRGQRFIQYDVQPYED